MRRRFFSAAAARFAQIAPSVTKHVAIQPSVPVSFQKLFCNMTSCAFVGACASAWAALRPGGTAPSARETYGTRPTPTRRSYTQMPAAKWRCAHRSCRRASRQRANAIEPNDTHAVSANQTITSPLEAVMTAACSLRATMGA